MFARILLNLGKKLIRKVELFLFKLYLFLILPFTYLRYIFISKKTQCNVILTSYPIRFDILFWTLLSILSQSVTSKITIVLYDKDRPILSLRLKIIIYVFKDFLSIYNSNYDFRSYKKILPIIEGRVFTKNVILCDDDIFYPPDWLKLLLRQLNRSPNGVVGTAGHLQTFLPNGEVDKYSKWLKRVSNSNSKNILLTGAGGIAFKATTISQSSLNNYDFMEVCPNNDDLWIHYIVLRNAVSHTTRSVLLPQLNPFDVHALYHVNGSGRLDREMLFLQAYLAKNKN
jgi:hypothetical protein